MFHTKFNDGMQAVEEVTPVRTYQRKPPFKIRNGYRQRFTRNLMFTITMITITNLPSRPLCPMDITTCNWSIWFERISENRRPRFEPDLMFGDNHYDYILEKCCCTYNWLKLARLLEF